jgi:hypothetical protein
MTEKRTDRVACGREELLVSVLYNEATPEERAEFEAHRHRCAACDDEFAAFSTVREGLGQWELERIPHIKVEVRPSLVARLKQAFALLPATMRLATAGACALLVLAALNTEISVGNGGVTFRTGLRPPTTGAVQQSPAIDEARIEQMVAERVDASVRSQLVAYRAELENDLDELEVRLASTRSTDDVRRLTVQVAAQRKRIDELQRDLDRTAGYGGSDLFSVVLNPAEPGS